MAPSNGSGDRRSLVCCGRGLLGQGVAIVDPRTLRHCAIDQVGEIWVRGSSVASGYWNRTEESAAVFRARGTDELSEAYLRTGDLGFMAPEGLYVTGRLKDVIIIRG